MIECGTNGILVAPGDPGALADAIEQVLGDPELRERLARNGRERILKRFEKSNLLRQLLALYARVQGSTERARN